MPAEHKRPEGWSQGYFCLTCGVSGLNMLGMHPGGEKTCKPNPELVAKLLELNKK